MICISTVHRGMLSLPWHPCFFFRTLVWFAPGTEAKFVCVLDKSPVCCGHKETVLHLNKLNSGQDKKDRNGSCEQGSQASVNRGHPHPPSSAPDYKNFKCIVSLDSIILATVCYTFISIVPLYNLLTIKWWLHSEKNHGMTVI